MLFLCLNVVYNVVHNLLRKATPPLKLVNALRPVTRWEAALAEDWIQRCQITSRLIHLWENITIQSALYYNNNAFILTGKRYQDVKRLSASLTKTFFWTKSPTLPLNYD